MEKHFRLVGYLLLIWGALNLLSLLFISLAPNYSRISPMQAAKAPIGITIVVVGIFYIIAGWTLLARKDWARKITIPASIVAVFNFPLGTALGIYGLWAMLSSQGREQFPAYTHPMAG